MCTLLAFPSIAYGPIYRETADVPWCVSGLLTHLLLHCVLTHLQEQCGCSLLHLWLTSHPLCTDPLTGKQWMLISAHVVYCPIHCLLFHLQGKCVCSLVCTWLTNTSIVFWYTLRETVVVPCCARGSQTPPLCTDLLKGSSLMFLANLVIVHFITQVHVITSALSLYRKKKVQLFF